VYIPLVLLVPSLSFGRGALVSRPAARGRCLHGPLVFGLTLFLSLLHGVSFIGSQGSGGQHQGRCWHHPPPAWVIQSCCSGPTLLALHLHHTDCLEGCLPTPRRAERQATWRWNALCNAQHVDGVHGINLLVDGEAGRMGGGGRRREQVYVEPTCSCATHSYRCC